MSAPVNIIESLAVGYIAIVTGLHKESRKIAVATETSVPIIWNVMITPYVTYQNNIWIRFRKDDLNPWKSSLSNRNGPIWRTEWRTDWQLFNQKHTRASPEQVYCRGSDWTHLGILGYIYTSYLALYRNSLHPFPFSTTPTADILPRPTP